MTNQRAQVADGLATALLAGPWTQQAMTRRAADALGRRAPPKWLIALVEVTRDAYRDRPGDRPRELAGFLQSQQAWSMGWASRRRPRIVRWTPVPTEIVTRPWPVTELPDLVALANLLDVDQGELAWFADVRSWERRVPEPLRHYRWTVVPKGDSVRVIAAPKPRLKEIQRRVLRHVLEPIPTHDAAHGCIKGRSVRTALAPHSGSHTVIRADLVTFFASIPAGRIWSLLRAAGLPEAVAYTLTGLVTTVVPNHLLPRLPAERRHRLRMPHLPQGAPTSPALANLVAYSLDRRLAGLAARFGARYTRYVDDLIFSGGPSLRNARSRFVAKVDEVVTSEGFGLNERKTVVLGASGRQSALGAVLNDRPTAARRERDALRALLHNCAVHGWPSQARGIDEFPAHVLGRISWIAGLDPRFGAKLRAAYDALDWSG